MSSLTIYRDNYAGSTMISNRFIDEYMKEANDAQLKIYLFLMRMMNSNSATSISDIADKFNHTEKDVLRALKYWEKNQLLSLDYNEAKSLVGIHMKDLDKPQVQEASQAPSVVTFTPAAAEPAPAQMPSPFAKPNYTLDQLKEFKSNEETAQILFIAEQYLGKTITPAEMKSILFFYDTLHFSIDLIDYLIEYCVEKGKKDFRYIEKVAINWAEEHITTPRQAALVSGKYDKTVYAIMKALGKNSSPTAKELDFIYKWTKTYSFSLDIITEACDRTVLATDKHRFEYADSILASWFKAQVRHKADITIADKKFQETRNSAAVKPVFTNNKFNQFTQNTYDFDALEQELLSN